MNRPTLRSLYLGDIRASLQKSLHVRFEDVPRYLVEILDCKGARSSALEVQKLITTLQLCNFNFQILFVDTNNFVRMGVQKVRKLGCKLVQIFFKNCTSIPSISLLSVLSFFRKYLRFLLVASEERKFSKDLSKNSLQEPVQDITAFFVTSLQETKACSRLLRDTRITFLNRILYRDTGLIASSNFFLLIMRLERLKNYFEIISSRIVSSILFFFFFFFLFPFLPGLSLLFAKFN